MNIDANLIKINPAAQHGLLLDEMTTGTDGVTYTVADPTIPLVNLLEANVSLTQAALIEHTLLIRKMYPNLSQAYTDLLPHISDDERVNIFATPGSTVMQFVVSVLDLEQQGYADPEDSDIRSMIIPKLTVIKTPTIDFTLLNDIRVKYYITSKKVYVEQLVSDISIAYTDRGVLESVITTDTDGNKVIQFNTYVKQLTCITNPKSVNVGYTFELNVPFSEQYHYTEAFIKNNDTSNEWTKMDIMLDELSFDIDTLSVKANITDNNVQYLVPDAHIVNDKFRGDVKFNTYITKGNVTANIEKYTYSDIIITLSSNAPTQEYSVTKKITLLAKPMTALTGGRNAKTFAELKESVITNTKGSRNIPINEYEIGELADASGFEVYKVIDTVTDRLFKCHKELPFVTNSYLYSRLDLFNFSTTIIGSENESSDVIVNESRGSVIIKSNAMFKDINGQVTVLTDTEKTALTLAGTKTATSDIINNGKYFVTPYHYVSEINDISIRTDAYDLANPSIDGLIIDNKAVGDITANIYQYGIIATSYGFKIVFTVIGNDLFTTDYLANATIKMALPLSNGSDHVYFTTTNDGTGYFNFLIETDFFIDKNDYISITNGTSNLVKRMVPLEAQAILNIYTNDNIEMSKEYVTINFGINLEYLWKHSFITYTERKYKKYTADVPMIYARDVFEIDPSTGGFFTITDENSDTVYDTLNYNILHSAGDPMLDDDDNPIYLHKEGETILDPVTGDPIIDVNSGVATTIDIIAYEMEYYFAKEENHKTYLADTLSTMKTYMTKDVAGFNAVVLDNTNIFYTGTRRNNVIKVQTGTTLHTIPAVFIPEITVYIYQKSAASKISMRDLTKTLGKVIHRALDGDSVNFLDIKQTVVDMFEGDVASIQISGIDNFNNEYFTYYRTDEKLSIDKRTFVDVNNMINVEYNMNINIVYI